MSIIELTKQEQIITQLTHEVFTMQKILMLQFCHVKKFVAMLL